jgi:hypothetical protein
MKETELNLAKAALDLRVANPQAWETFLNAMLARSNERREQCVYSPPENLVKLQGAAQEMGHLLLLLANAPKAVEEAREQERKKNGYPANRRI